jgi:DNA-binding transcriptional ArsR family regulator
MQLQPVDRMFSALADPNRRFMVERLGAGPATVTELAAPAGLRLPSALKHLRILEEGGIVLSSKAGRARTYRIRTGALTEISDWARRREAEWNKAFDRLAAAMQDLPEEDTE